MPPPRFDDPTSIGCIKARLTERPFSAPRPPPPCTWAERAPRSAGRRADKGRLCRLRSLRPQGRPLHALRRRPVPAPRQDALASSIFKVPWGDLGFTTLVKLAW